MLRMVKFETHHQLLKISGMKSGSLRQKTTVTVGPQNDTSQIEIAVESEGKWIEIVIETKEYHMTKSATAATHTISMIVTRPQPLMLVTLESLEEGRMEKGTKNLEEDMNTIKIWKRRSVKRKKSETNMIRRGNDARRKMIKTVSGAKIAMRMLVTRTDEKKEIGEEKKSGVAVEIDREWTRTLPRKLMILGRSATGVTTEESNGDEADQETEIEVKKDLIDMMIGKKTRIVMIVTGMQTSNRDQER